MGYIYSFAWRTLQERWRTTVLFQAKFRVSASEISRIFCEVPKIWWNTALCSNEFSLRKRHKFFARTFNKERKFAQFSLALLLHNTVFGSLPSSKEHGSSHMVDIVWRTFGNSHSQSLFFRHIDLFSNQATKIGIMPAWYVPANCGTLYSSIWPLFSCKNHFFATILATGRSFRLRSSAAQLLCNKEIVFLAHSE